MSEIKRNDKGFPLKEDGTIDWVLTSKEKQDYFDRFEKEKNTKKYPTNHTPKKNKRKNK